LKISMTKEQLGGAVTILSIFQIEYGWRVEPNINS